MFAVFVVVAIGTGVIAWEHYERLPRFQLSAPVSLALIAAFEGYTAAAIRARLSGRPRTKPIMPILVARYAALAKASSLTSVMALGAWAAIVALAATRHRDAFRYAERDVLIGGAGIIAGVLMLAAALRLEHACRVKHPPEHQDG
ncbi:MAG: DUF3180 domain-containing protein [Mycobacteriales bacterium]